MLVDSDCIIHFWLYTVQLNVKFIHFFLSFLQTDGVKTQIEPYFISIARSYFSNCKMIWAHNQLNYLQTISILMISLGTIFIWALDLQMPTYFPRELSEEAAEKLRMGLWQMEHRIFAELLHFSRLFVNSVRLDKTRLSQRSIGVVLASVLSRRGQISCCSFSR